MRLSVLEMVVGRTHAFGFYMRKERGRVELGHPRILGEAGCRQNTGKRVVGPHKGFVCALVL